MKKDYWILKVFIITFILSICFSFITNIMSASFNSIILIVILLCVIAIGIIFEIVIAKAYKNSHLCLGKPLACIYYRY